MPLRNFIKKNKKFSFYFKEHKLKPYPGYPGVYHIVRRKGKKRLDISQLDLFKKKLDDWQFWDSLINNNNDEFYQIEEQRIKRQEKLFRFEKGGDYNLKERQEYAIEHAKGRILDVGFFDGKTLCFLLEKGNDCEGVDFGDTYVEVARENFRAAGGDPEKIIKGLFQNLPYKDETFDTVISQETLEHFFFPDIMIEEVRRVLKTGGFFIGSTPLENRIDSETHIVYYEESGVKALLEDGFKIRDFQLIKDLPQNQRPQLIVWTAEKI